jgi:hypothetical protein
MTAYISGSLKEIEKSNYMDKSMFVNNFYRLVFQPFLSILTAFLPILPFSTEFAYLFSGGAPPERQKLRSKEVMKLGESG